MWLKIIVLLCGVTCALAAKIPNGGVSPLDGRIVGGYDIPISKVPWQVSLKYVNGGHFCGGSIYSDSTIITAAHCVRGLTRLDFVVRAGSNYTTTGGWLRDVSSILIHPSYVPSTSYADVALVKLATPLPLGILMEAIPLATSPPDQGAPALVSGWGTTQPGATTLPVHLKAANVGIISYANCRSSNYGYGGEILPGMICAAAPGKDSCQGDSGGPLVSGGVLVGIVSWGRSCALSYYPGVYTSASFFNSWIVSNA